MLKRIDLKQNDIGAISAALSASSIVNADVEQTVLAIINDVKIRETRLYATMQKSLMALSLKFLVSDAEIDEAYNSCEQI
ncbi:MAG: hypothetical protein CM15mP49_01790 [Actinomycetota bacterium]|nr:MAG: hypothetical protein CM15mP49_01790 [Actinomycetota bacterium]